MVSSSKGRNVAFLRVFKGGLIVKEAYGGASIDDFDTHP